MGAFYFDDSIHSRGDFVLGAFVYSEDPLERHVEDALRENGMEPGVHEFKSGTFMVRNPQQSRVRELLKRVVYDHCRIGIVVAPYSARSLFGREALQGLNKILSTNGFRSLSHDAFFDEGIKVCATGDNQVAAKAICGDQRCTLHFEQDSKQVVGLQVADLIAHTCATMLLAQLGLVKKKVKSGENSGYDPNSDMKLEFELWASVRWNFFAAAPPSPDTWKSQLDFQVDVASRGLHIAEACDETVKEAALSRFGAMYLGCIH